MSLHSLPPLLRDEPALAAVLGASLRGPGRARDGPSAHTGRADEGLIPLAPTRRGPHRDGRTAPRGRPPAVPAAGGRRAVPGLGDAAVRTGEPQRGDHGSAAAGALAPHQHRDRRGRAAPSPGDRRRNPSFAPAARPGRCAHRTGGDQARSDLRCRGPAGSAGVIGLPPGGAGGAPRRGGSPRLHHRRLSLHGRRAGPRRPVG